MDGTTTSGSATIDAATDALSSDALSSDAFTSDALSSDVTPNDAPPETPDEVDAQDTRDGATEGELVPFDDAHWQRAIGRWTFVDPTTARSDGDVMSSLLYLRAPTPKDFEASVDVEFARENSSAGVIFRERGEDFYGKDGDDDARFYQFEWYTRGSHHDRRLSFMKKDPYWIQLVVPETPEAPLHAWIRFRVRARGDHIETFIDDRPVFDVHDHTFVRAGRIGLHCFMPRTVSFRAFRLAWLRSD